MDLVPVEYPVLLSVIELFFDAIADFKTMVGCDRDIAGIEKPVNVGSEEQAIIHAVGAAFAKGLYVGSL